MSKNVPAKMTSEAVEATLKKEQEKIKTALQNLIPLDAFIGMAVSSFNAVPTLRNCTPTSFYLALYKAAQLGLEPGSAKNQCNILPFKNKRGEYEATFIPQWHGLRDLAYRTGLVRSLSAGIVYEGDLWEEGQSFEPYFNHVPNYGGDVPRHERPVKLVYAAALMMNGGKFLARKTYDEIERIRKQYSKQANGPAWTNSWGPMAIKTVFKDLFKYLPREQMVHVKDAIAHDNDAYYQMPSSQPRSIPEMPRAKEDDPIDIGEAPEVTEEQTTASEPSDEELKEIQEKKALELECKELAEKMGIAIEFYAQKIESTSAKGLDALIALRDKWVITLQNQGEAKDD
jgi:recombination protein RecT